MMRLSISGMTCNHCVKTVTATLKGVPGVTVVKEVDLGRQEAVVEGAPDVAALVEALRGEGFEARVQG
jgi:copper chaperone CopZ